MADPAVLGLPETFTYAQARAVGLTKHAVYRLEAEGQIERLSRGLYRRTDREVSDLDLEEIAQRSSDATLCLATALARHGLTDEIPAAIDVALPRGTRPPVTGAPVAWHFFAPKTFVLGREPLELGSGTTIKLYGPERSIIDAFRTRGHGGHELAYESLKRWLRRPGSNPASLLKLAGEFPRVQSALRHALELLL